MELAYLLILGIVSSVTCTPHGYGAQSGAVAKAGAVSFAGVPNISALNGAGALGLGGAGNAAGNGGLGGSFSSSGSFSKSSASSFASSSASSFSYSGSGAFSGTKGPGSYPASGQGAPITSPEGFTTQNGANAASGAVAGSNSYPGYSNTPSNENCGAGGCDNSDNKHGASDSKLSTNFNNAQSTSGAAVANANGLTGSTSNCGDTKCNVPASENKCTTGNCAQNIPSTNDNDIVVNVPSYSGTKTSYDADAQSLYFNANNPSGCSGGDCSTFGTNTKNNADSGAQAEHSSQGNNGCNGPNCNSYNASPTGNSRPTYNQPSTFLTAPKDDKPERCTSGNCGSTSTPSNNYPNYPTKTSCNTPNCQTQIASGVSTSSNAATNSNSVAGSYVNNYNLQGTKCTSPNCGSQSNNPQVFKCTSPNCESSPQNSASYPNNLHVPQKIDQGHIYSPTNCGSGNCGSLAGANSGATVPTGQYKPIYESPNKQPMYTGGFGAPSGVLSPIKPNIPQASAPSANYPTVPGIASHPPSSPNNQPIYNGGFGGPAGILKPNDYSAPSHPSFNQPKPVPPTSYHPQPVNNPTTGSTTNSKTPANDEELNFVPLNPNKQIPGNNINVHNQAGSSAIAAARASAGVYSGGFGGPPGLLKPYDNGDKGSSLTQKYNKPGFIGQGGNTINNHNALAGNNYNSATGGTAGAFAGTGASAGAGGLGNGGYYDKQYIQENTNGGASQGCSGGCRPAGGYGGATGFNLGGSFGLSKSGIFDGLSGGLHAAGAGAKSIAGAIGTAGAGSLGLSGSFAGSAATAHASSGAYKDGYAGK